MVGSVPGREREPPRRCEDRGAPVRSSISGRHVSFLIARCLGYVFNRYAHESRRQSARSCTRFAAWGGWARARARAQRAPHKHACVRYARPVRPAPIRRYIWRKYKG